MPKTYLEQYHEEIQNGNIVVGYWIRKEIENLINDLKDSRYIYDTKEAHLRFKFQEKFAFQTSQSFYMQPIKLMLWQKAFWEVLYSFKVAETGKRRFNEALLEVARRNGKSVMFGADGFTDLMIGAGGSTICCASNTDDQCRIIWDKIADMQELLDPKKEVARHNLVDIINKHRNIKIFRLSSRTQKKDGREIYKTYLDESHDIDEEQANSEIAEACWRGMSNAKEPLFLNCTTQGFNRGCYLDKKIADAKAIIEGEIDNIHFLPFLYEQDSEQEIWQNESSWAKSNPSLIYGVKQIDKLRQDVEAAKRDNASRVHMLCKDFNIPQNMAVAWLNLEDYEYEQEAFSLDEFKNCYCLAAADLSETTDLTNLKLLLMKPNDNTKYIHSNYWIPESKLQNSDDARAGANYKEWAKEGYLTICEGNDNDLTLVADYLMELKKKYNIRALRVYYDVRSSKDFTNRLDYYGIDCEIVQQNATTMSTPMKLVAADSKSRFINYNNNPMDKWCFANASVEFNNRDECLCVKVQPSMRIDGAVTTIILYEGYRRARSEFMRLIK